MTIKTGTKSTGIAPIRLAATGSKLALNNVTLNLGSDWHFTQGQLFVHNNVVVAGTSAFIYQSPSPSFITSGATWLFDQGTTFSIAPATYTSAPYTLDPNATSTPNDFIVTADPSSVLYLNGCSLKTTYTGLRLTHGTVLMDNHVQIDTQAGVDLASNGAAPMTLASSTITGINPISVSWSPDGNYIAIVNTADNTLQIYRYTADNPSNPPTLVGSAPTGQNPSHVAWSPDGRLIAVVNNGDSTLKIYRFTGASSPVLVGSANTDTNQDFDLTLKT
jgi:WD40 repeat protein